MLSRVAENVFWMTRYVERAENLSRLLDVGFDLELEGSGLLGDAESPLQQVVTILGCRADFDKLCPEDSPNGLLKFLAFERSFPFSILGMLVAARENARGTQDAVNAEAWSQLNRLYLYLNGPKALRKFESSPRTFFGLVRRSCILWDGLVDSTLPRNETFHFMQLGRFLERIDQISRALAARAATLAAETDSAQLAAPRMQIVHWTALLRSCSAYESFLSDRGEKLDPEAVVRYLVLDPEFPRSIRYCAARCRESIGEITGGDGDAYGSEAERLLGRLDGELRYIDVQEIFDRGLTRFLTGVQESCDKVGEEIHRAYFAT